MNLALIRLGLVLLTLDAAIIITCVSWKLGAPALVLLASAWVISKTKL